MQQTVMTVTIHQLISAQQHFAYNNSIHHNILAETNYQIVSWRHT